MIRLIRPHSMEPALQNRYSQPAGAERLGESRCEMWNARRLYTLAILWRQAGIKSEGGKKADAKDGISILGNGTEDMLIRPEKIPIMQRTATVLVGSPRSADPR